MVLNMCSSHPNCCFLRVQASAALLQKQVVSLVLFFFNPARTEWSRRKTFRTRLLRAARGRPINLRGGARERWNPDRMKTPIPRATLSPIARRPSESALALAWSRFDLRQRGSSTHSALNMSYPAVSGLCYRQSGQSVIREITPAAVITGEARLQPSNPPFFWHCSQLFGWKLNLSQEGGVKAETGGRPNSQWGRYWQSHGAVEPQRWEISGVEVVWIFEISYTLKVAW